MAKGTKERILTAVPEMFSQDYRDIQKRIGVI